MHDHEPIFKRQLQFAGVKRRIAPGKSRPAPSQGSDTHSDARAGQLLGCQSPQRLADCPLHGRLMAAGMPPSQGDAAHALAALGWPNRRPACFPTKPRRSPEKLVAYQPRRGRICRRVGIAAAPWAFLRRVVQPAGARYICHAPAQRISRGDHAPHPQASSPTRSSGRCHSRRSPFRVRTSTSPPSAR